MGAIQLDFFKTVEESKIDSALKTVDELKQSSEKVRKSTFAKLGELTHKDMDLEKKLEAQQRNNLELLNMCLTLQQRLEVLERNICKK